MLSNIGIIFVLVDLYQLFLILDILYMYIHHLIVYLYYRCFKGYVYLYYVHRLCMQSEHELSNTCICYLLFNVVFN